MMVVDMEHGGMLGDNPTETADHAVGILLHRLRQGLLLMAGHVEEMIAEAVDALVGRNIQLAKRTILRDVEVNGCEIELDGLCQEILAGYALGDADLRFVTRALKMVTDLERIGDLAVNISERVIDLASEPPLKPWRDIPQMAEIVRSMVRDAIDAFVEGNAELAEAVIGRDDAVDKLYDEVFSEVFAIMAKDPSTLQRGIHLQSIGKWLERMADHSTNLAEQVIFMVRGRDVRHQGKLPAERR